MIRLKYSISVCRSLMILGLGLMLGCAVSGCKSYDFPDVNIDQKAMKQTVGQLCALTPARSISSVASLDAAAGIIQQRLNRLGYACEEQVYDVRGVSVRNILASIGPEGAPRYVVGAHYDVCGNQPGADDNASGVAGLIELARLMRRHKDTMTVRIDFVAFTLEEPPFFRTQKMGSYIHATSLAEQSVDVKGMIALDMIGYFTEEKQTYPIGFLSWFYPSKANFIAVIGGLSDWGLNADVTRGMMHSACPVSSIKAPAWIQGIDFSDHLNYWKFGYDAVLVTDTAFFRNNRYHRKTDTPDTLNYKQMAEVVKGLYWMLYNETVEPESQ